MARQKRSVSLDEAGIEWALWAHALLSTGDLPSPCDFFGERVRLLVLASGLGPTAFAREAGIPTATVSEALHDSRIHPPLETGSKASLLQGLHRMCQAIGQGLGVAWIYCSERCPPELNSRELRLDWMLLASGLRRNQIDVADNPSAAVGCSPSWLEEGRAAPPDAVVRARQTLEAIPKHEPRHVGNRLLFDHGEVLTLEQVLRAAADGQVVKTADRGDLLRLWLRTLEFQAFALDVGALEVTLDTWRANLPGIVATTLLARVRRYESPPLPELPADLQQAMQGVRERGLGAVGG